MSCLKQKIASLSSERKIFLLLLFFSVLFIYFQSIWFDFVWDDIPFLKENELVKSLKNIPLFFTTGMPTLQAPIHYRPVTMTSLAIDYFLWGDNPAGYHIFNILLHTASTLVLYLLISSIIQNNVAAFLAAFIFAVHPAHCDAVCWIMARGDIICGLFLLLSFLSYLKKKQIISVISFIVALLAKEMAVTFPAIIFIYSYFVDKDKKNAIKGFVLFMSFVSFYLLLRSYVLETPFGEKQPFEMRFYTSFTLLLNYMKILFFPINLKLLYHGLPVYNSFLNFQVIVSFIVIICILFLAFLFKKREPLIWFSVLFFFISLLPVSGLPVLIDVAMIADRYLYVPMIGAAIFFARLLEILILKRREKIKFIYTITLIVIMLLSILTFKRKFFWENEFVFLTKMVQDAPYYHEAKTILGYHYIQKGNLDEAERLLKMALKIKPDYPEGLNTLGTIYLRKGNYELAKTFFSKAIYYNSLHPEAHSNLAIVYAIEKNYDNAEREFKTAIALKPKFIKARLNLARMYIEQKRFVEAEENIALVLQLGNNEEAKELLQLLKERQRTQ